MSQNLVVAPGKPVSLLHALLCSGFRDQQCCKDALLVNQLGNCLVTCRDNTLPLLLLWCSGKGAQSSDHFLSPQKLHVLCVAGTAKARSAATTRVWAVQTWLGAMERSWMRHWLDMDWAASTRQPCSNPGWTDCYINAKVSSWSSANWAVLKSKLF